MVIYAVQIAKRHRTFITALNGGMEPHESMFKGKHWLVFGVEDDGSDTINHEIMQEREMINTYDIMNSSPLFIRLKRA